MLCAITLSCDMKKEKPAKERIFFFLAAVLCYAMAHMCLRYVMRYAFVMCLRDVNKEQKTGTKDKKDVGLFICLMLIDRVLCAMPKALHR